MRLDKHEYHKADKAFSVQPGDSVTLVGTVGEDQYTVYPNADAYNKAKAENKDKDLQFVRVGNKYISTYARFWGMNDLDNNPQPDKSLFNKSGNTLYDFDGKNLKVTVTYTAAEVGILGDNSKKYVVTFADEKDTKSIDQFWLTNDATILYVYSTVGWRDIDRVNEAMDGVGGNSGNGKYYKNSNENINGLPKAYIAHPGDIIYLAGVGSGTFGEVSLPNGNGDSNSEYINQNKVVGQKPMGDNSNIGSYVMLKMPDSVNGNTNYMINYVTDDGSSRTFYFRLGNESAWNTSQYDHADIEIADGGIYKMVAEHHVNPDGTVIETVRTYGASITKVFHCDIHLKSTNEIYTIPEADYSSQGSPGETQYELTSKYKVENGQRIKNPAGFPEWIVNDRPKFTQNDVKDADFYVNVHLIPESEITTITYQDGTTEEIINSDFDESGAIDIANVQLHMNSQSVVDAVNKCPDHSGLDFTIRDEEITSKLRSGNAVIQARKLLKTEKTDLSDELVGGEFEFELYKCDSNAYNITGKTPVSTVTNNANGYVYFDQQFYIYSGTGNATHTDYYVIKEKIPASPDASITYSTREVKVKITYEPIDVNGSPTYKTTVEYDGAEDAVPEIVNTKKTYMLPSTGGSGTTIFYICGPALMLAAAALFVIRRRKEENQH